jgi:molybdopterin-guanine dinucleotide biosynthesis protein A
MKDFNQTTRKYPWYATTAAVVLAGGSSRRMGLDKAFLDIAGTPLIKQVISQLENLFPQVVISTGYSDKYTELGCTVIEDEDSECGPLSGIRSTLKSTNYDMLFVTACDIPHIDQALVQALHDAIPGYQASIPAWDGTLQPLHGLYTSDSIQGLETMYSTSELRASAIIDYLTVNVLDISGQARLFNINTPEDYRNYIKSLR